MYMITELANFIRSMEEDYGYGAIKGIELNREASEKFLYEISYFDFKYDRKIIDNEVKFMDVNIKLFVD